MTRFDRRSFVRACGAGATALCLPVLRGSVARAATAAPACFVAVYRANGVIRPQWWPTGGETDFVLGPSMQALEPWRRSLIIPKGINMATFKLPPGDQHQQGVGQLLTGRALLPGPFVGNGMNPPAGWASGPSIDQVIARQLGVQTLDLGVLVTGRNDTCSRVVYTDANRPRDPQNSPVAAYDSIFKNFVTPTGGDAQATMARLRARRQSVIDYVQGDIRALAARLPGADRPRLDAHLDGVRALERKLAALDTPSSARPAACAPPTRPGDKVAPLSSANMPTTIALQSDLLVAALACGVTRVGSLQWSLGTSQIPYTWVGVQDNHHDLSHKIDADSVAKLARIDAWLAAQFAYLVGKMDAAGLLDSSVVLFANDLGDGYTHQGTDIPFVVAGRAGGKLRPGRFLQYPGRSHNDLLLALANAVGAGLTTFGDPAFCAGPLPNLG